MSTPKNINPINPLINPYVRDNTPHEEQKKEEPDWRSPMKYENIKPQNQA